MTKKKPIPMNEWKWFGNAGHLCVGDWCRFHLCTQIGSYLISTVGAYVPPQHGSERAERAWLKNNWPGEEIGAGRKYETMVFLAGEPCVREGCNCGLPEPAGDAEKDFAGYMTAGEAAKGHMAMCEKWAAI